jgi:hypothetical protein
MSQSEQTPRLDSEYSKRVAAYDQPGADPEESWISALVDGIKQSTPPSEPAKKSQTAAVTPTPVSAERFPAGGSSAEATHSDQKPTKP